MDLSDLNDNWSCNADDFLSEEEEPLTDHLESVAEEAAEAPCHMADYSQIFKTDKFLTKAELIEWVDKVSKSIGFIVVVDKDDDGSKKGKTPRLYFKCERHGVYKPRPKPGIVKKRRDCSSKKCGCPFMLRGNPVLEAPDYWNLVVIIGKHNHQPFLHLDGHSRAARLKAEEEEYVRKLTTIGSRPRDIYRGLKLRDPKNVSSMRTIYNMRHKHQLVDKAGKSQMQYLFGKLKEHEYYVWERTNKETDEILELFFAHPTSIDLLRPFPQVLNIDSTYKTTRYKLPLLEIVGQTSTKKTFCIAFVFMSSEKEKNYTWAMSALRRVMVNNMCALPNIIVTDRELSLMNAIDEVFPDATHLLCTWHINRNICSYSKKVLPKADMGEKFLEFYVAVQHSATIEEYKKNLTDLHKAYAYCPKVLEYLMKQWIDSYGHKFLNVYTNKIKHLGNHTSNRSESAHSSLKREIGTSLCTFEQFWDKVHALLRIQHSTIFETFERSLFRPRQASRGAIFRDIKGKLSCTAIQILEETIRKAGDLWFTPAKCDCVIRTTHNLPCACECDVIAKEGRSIQTSECDVYWSTLAIKPRENVGTEDELTRNLSLIDSTIRGYGPQVQDHIINRMMQILDPATSHVLEPKEPVVTKGRKKAGVDKSTKRNPSGFEYPSLGASSTPATIGSTAASAVKAFIVRKCKDKAPPKKEKATRSRKSNKGKGLSAYGSCFPEYLHEYIATVEDVAPDGNCGFRAVTLTIKGNADAWEEVRRDLMFELSSERDLWERVFDGAERVDNLLRRLDCFKMYESGTRHWMTLPDYGLVIATRYQCIVYHVSLQLSYTYFPLRGVPPRSCPIVEVGIGFVHGNHFVNIVLDGPLPDIYPMWFAFRTCTEVTNWAIPIGARLNKYHQIKPAQPPTLNDGDHECYDLTGDA